MTMAKGITNGAQPMGAVAVSERIHDTIMGAAPEGAIEFFHGYTYSGHPAACAAGLATLDIYRNEGLFERGRELSPYFLDAIFSLKDMPVVADIRGYGMMAAIDVAPGRRARARAARCSRRSCSTTACNLKTTGDCAIIAPPLIAEKQHVDVIADILRKTLRDALSIARHAASPAAPAARINTRRSMHEENDRRRCARRSPPRCRPGRRRR